MIGKSLTIIIIIIIIFWVLCVPFCMCLFW
jgi:hypothetical protein